MSVNDRASSWSSRHVGLESGIEEGTPERTIREYAFPIAHGVPILAFVRVQPNCARQIATNCGDVSYAPQK